MRLNNFYLSLILLSYSYSNHLEKFYKSLEQQSVIKLSISITQDQFEKKYNSSGDFFILGSKKYFYDSSELEISIDDDHIVTKNHLSKQIVLSDLGTGELNLFDIISGNRDYIDFIDYKEVQNRYDFNIPSMGFKGYFLFEPKNGNLKLISLHNGSGHYVSIDIDKIEILDIYSPKIEEEDFEVIDLRG